MFFQETYVSDVFQETNSRCSEKLSYQKSVFGVNKFQNFLSLAFDSTLYHLCFCYFLKSLSFSLPVHVNSSFFHVFALGLSEFHVKELELFQGEICPGNCSSFLISETNFDDVACVLL